MFQFNEIDALPGVATTESGAVGTVTGVAVVVSEALPAPAEFTARICTLYVVPFASAEVPFVESAEMTSGLDVPPTVRVCHVAPPPVEYWYEVIGLPPSSPGEKYTVSSALLVSIREIVGAVGDVSGVTGDDGAEGTPIPTELIAYTRK